ncbi:MAG: bifunctional riboflavin kinase/FAD synthetase [Alphaproteobacteria bacterium]|jgi:riboflavin kinase/FMN adenylyltransferase|nr:bifunctional riboflavin kinase/FAD synthetase [Alphaproteobacteria bacterium]
MIKLHNNLEEIPDDARGSVCVIGNFDGLHLGHQALLRQAADIARIQNAPLSVLTFEPHPREFFQPDTEPFRLTLLPAKQRILGSLGVAHLFAAEFNAQLAALTAEDFIEKVLKNQLGVRHVMVGRDFAFGRGRAGNVEQLRRIAGFGVTAIDPVTCDGEETYSSTRVRGLLRAGKLDDAAALLGRRWEIDMPVVHGDKRGRELGYPTANQQAGRYLRLPLGIYAVRVLIEGETVWREGVANFGIRPMFRITQPIFETYIFDFDSEIYGKNLRVQPVKFLRPEQEFKGLEALSAQIKQDCHAAAAVLKSTSL